MKLSSFDDKASLFECANDMLESIRFSYPKNHPIIGRHLFLLALLLTEMEIQSNENEAKIAILLNESQQIFDYIYGSDHHRSITNRQLLASILMS
jgi:hypothetical protein